MGETESFAPVSSDPPTPYSGDVGSDPPTLYTGDVGSDPPTPFSGDVGSSPPTLGRKVADFGRSRYFPTVVAVALLIPTLLAVSSEITSSRSTVTSLESRVGELNSQVNQLHSEIDKLNWQNDKFKRQLRVLKDGKTHKLPRTTPSLNLGIKITSVPMGRDTGRITGTVSGLENPSNYRVLVYTRTNDVWFIQPNMAANPPIPIGGDGTWASEGIRIGETYAALLVPESYQYDYALMELPPKGNGVLAVVTASP